MTFEERATRADDRVDELLDDASRRAWTADMTVRPFGDAYLVSCEDGTQFVSLTESDCSCDEEGVCIHRRRVAIEINRGRVPPPAARTVDCQGCDREVAASVAGEPPFLCPDCDLAPGDIVVDAEGSPDTPLLVISSPGRPSDVVTVPDDGCTVAEYPGNGDQPPDAPVVECVYPQAVSTERPPRRYVFPVTRLVDPDEADDGEAAASLSGK